MSVPIKARYNTDPEEFLQNTKVLVFPLLHKGRFNLINKFLVGTAEEDIIDVNNHDYYESTLFPV